MDDVTAVVPAEPGICVPRTLPENLWIHAANVAAAINPNNLPYIKKFAQVSGFVLEKLHVAAVAAKYWGTKGCKLSVQFLDNPTQACRRMLLEAFNSWNAYANVSFAETAGQGQVRLLRDPQDGYWSYLGTDILSIPSNQPTMNLAGFTERTSAAEYLRVPPHEAGHTIGLPHEHMRKAIVDQIDRELAIAYFMRTQGWKRNQVEQQVLIPLEEASLIGASPADENSIMCYQLPGSIMKDRQPVLGGSRISATDAEYIAKIYPKPDAPPPPPPPSGRKRLVIEYDGDVATCDIPGFRVTKLT